MPEFAQTTICFAQGREARAAVRTLRYTAGDLAMDRIDFN
jgi:hypothetical protein